MSKIENPTYKAPEEDREKFEATGEIEAEGRGEQLEQNELVRVRGEEGKWYFLGGGDEKSLISSLPDTPENVDNAKISKWVKTADLEKA